jgi:hypothetical protein
MADKDQQHIIPKTFLRRFEIPNYKSPNHVWCYNFEDNYINEPKAKGVNSSISKSSTSIHYMKMKISCN